jgi:hypothetical protein
MPIVDAVATGNQNVLNLPFSEAAPQINGITSPSQF